MRTKLWPVAVVWMAVVAMGCSGSSVSEIASSGPAGAGLAASLATLPNPDGQSNQPRETKATKAQVTTEKFATPPADAVDLFTPPKFVIPVVTKEPEPKDEPEAAKEPAEVESDTPPPLRLLGFVDVDGLKALLSVNGSLNIVTIGDSVSNVEIIAVEAPYVTLRHGTEEFQLNLFEQEWFHAANPTGPVMGRQRSFGRKPVRSAGSFGVSRIPQPPGSRHRGSVGALQLPAVPSFAGSDNQVGGLPGLPGFKRESQGGLPDLPRFGEEGYGSLPRLP